MYYVHDEKEFRYCHKCEQLEALARLGNKSFIPCRQCWERYIVAHEEEVDELL